MAGCRQVRLASRPGGPSWSLEATQVELGLARRLCPGLGITVITSGRHFRAANPRVERVVGSFDFAILSHVGRLLVFGGTVADISEHCCWRRRRDSNPRYGNTPYG